LKWIEIFGYGIGLLKYVFLAALSLFVAYMIGLLRKSID
jgi:hypothetical protein